VTGADRSRVRAGWMASLVVLALYGGLGLSVDFKSAAVDLWSDEATYYLMAHSLAADGDLEYRQPDLVRALREFPRGPSGVFLKRGTDVQAVRPSAGPPFVEFVGPPDPDASRLYFGKSFAYPLAAAPFVWLLGTNGFLVLNALLLAAAFFAAYLFTSARSGTAVGLLWASAFVFASVVPVYAVWIAPELFNWSLGVLAYFLWLYKHVAHPASAPAPAWLMRPITDWLAAALIGLLTFSKISNVLLLVPMVGWLLWTRAWMRAGVVMVTWGLSTTLWFGLNVASSGDWNYQGGGDRVTCYGTYPFQQAAEGLEVCDERGRTDALTDVIFDPDVFWTNLRANIVYFAVGRNSGVVAYFVPVVFATGALIVGWRRAASWQWFTLGGIVLQALLFIVTQPYSYFGGGGSVGNRYFMGGYGPAVFLLPVISSAVWVLVVPWIVGGLFMAKLVLNPFQTSIRPGDHAKSGPFRWLPVEMTNINDLPINNQAERVRVWYGDSGAGDPGFQIYYLDDNAYLKEADGLSFWIRGESRAEMIVKTDQPYRSLRLTLSAGAAPTTVTVTLAGKRVELPLAAGQSGTVQLDLGDGFPYKKHGGPTPAWILEIASTGGFAPAVTEGSADRRYLGVRVLPIIVR
jgi:hypothetical protein